MTHTAHGRHRCPPSVPSPAVAPSLSPGRRGGPATGPLGYRLGSGLCSTLLPVPEACAVNLRRLIIMRPVHRRKLRESPSPSAAGWGGGASSLTLPTPRTLLGVLSWCCRGATVTEPAPTPTRGSSEGRERGLLMCCERCELRGREGVSQYALARAARAVWPGAALCEAAATPRNGRGERESRTREWLNVFTLELRKVC